MLWVLVLHISALLLWCAALLYLPVLVTAELGRDGNTGDGARPLNRLERFVFTSVATPAALVAIISGTLVFVLDRTVDGWLIVKLTLVTGLVVCHTLAGLLVLRAEAVSAGGLPNGASPGRLSLWGRILGFAVVALIAAILWVVLAKSSGSPLW